MLWDWIQAKPLATIMLSHGNDIFAEIHSMCKVKVMQIVVGCFKLRFPQCPILQDLVINVKFLNSEVDI